MTAYSKEARKHVRSLAEKIREHNCNENVSISVIYISTASEVQDDNKEEDSKWRFSEVPLIVLRG